MFSRYKCEHEDDYEEVEDVVVVVLVIVIVMIGIAINQNYRRCHCHIHTHHIISSLRRFLYCLCCPVYLNVSSL